jgi:4-carboxymuconolactone decarboxylase
MPDPVREELRAQGSAVVQHLRHGVYPQRSRPLHLSTIPGIQHYTTEALWGSVWARPALDIETRTLLTLAVLTSLQRLQQLRTYLNSALNIGIGVDRIEEVLVQCSVLAGFPTTVNALELLRDVLEHRGVTVAEVAQEDTSPPEVSADELERRGRQLREQLFGDEDARPGPAAPAPARVLWQVEDRFVFGDLYLRPALELPLRVACTIASLVALREQDELARWLVAGLRVGLSAESIGETMLQAAHYAGFAAARQAMAVADRVLAASGDPGQ